MCASHNSDSYDSRENLERAVLGAVCHHFQDGTFRPIAISALVHYPFTVPDHQCIFSALRQIRASPPESLRRLLINRLNNMGFPELDTNFLFDGQACLPHKALELIQALLALAERSH